MLLQKVDDKEYVQRKISLMYKRADVANETNRLGLAMGVGLVSSLFEVNHFSEGVRREGGSDYDLIFMTYLTRIK